MMLALIGINANAAMYIVGTNPFGGWNPAVGLEMELQADGSYSLDATLTTDATIYFIFTEAIGDWTAVNGNRWDPGTGSDLTVQSEVEFTAVKGNTDKSFKFTGTIGEKYTFTFNRNTGKAMVSGYVEPITEIIYTALGNSADIFGETWNTGLTQNVMTLDETDGLYKLVKNGVEIAGGFTLEYKVHDNLGNWYPDGPNQTYYFEESGTYDLTFTFNAGTSEVGLAVTKVSDGPEVNPLTGELYMLGQVNGNNWAGNVGVPMATEDSNIFTLTDAVIADANEGYGYFSFASKLGADENDWAFQAYRRGSLANDTIIEAGVLTDLGEWGTANAFRALAGYYDVTVNLSAGTVLLTAKEAPQPEVDDVYIIGDVNNFSTTTEWDPTKGVKLTYNEGIYTGEVTTTPKVGQELAYIGFSKKIADAESENPWGDIEAYRFGPMSTGDFVMTEELLGSTCELAEEGYATIAIPAGTWTFTIDLANGTFMIDGTWPTDTVIPEPYTGNLYILGEVNGNGWNPTDGVQMTYDSENAVFTAEVTAEATNYDSALEGNYSFFSFTKMLADTVSENPWGDIADSRIGAVAEGSFLVTNEYLGVPLKLTNGDIAFKVPSGFYYNLTVSVDNMTIVITKGDALEPAEPYTGDLFVLGEANGNSWAPNVGVPMTYDSENAVFTANIAAKAQNYDSELEANYSYFSFTKLLAETADDWAAIANSRLGAVAEGSFLVINDYLGVPLSLTNGETSFKVLSGYYYDLTVSVDSMTIVITRGEAIEPDPVEPYTGDLYILGEVNGNSWAPNVGVPMTYDAENAVFKAQVTAEAENYDSELEANYSYFSFTKMLAETADDWAAIASSRMGAVAEGSFLVTDEYLGQNLSLTKGEVSFRVPSGNTYDITVSVDEMYVIINKVEWALGDVNHDHFVNVADVTALIKYILTSGAEPEEFYTEQANVDGDAADVLNVADVTALIQVVLNQ